MKHQKTWEHFLHYLLSPENTTDWGTDEKREDSGSSAWPGLVKTLFWFGIAVCIPLVIANGLLH